MNLTNEPATFTRNPHDPKLRIRCIILFVCTAVLASGCRTIDSNAASTFASTVTTIKSQANGALNAAASLTRDAGVAYVVTRPTLKESDFAETPTAEIISEWDNTLSSIETYALNLSALSSPNISRNFDAAATNLFNQMTVTAKALNTRALSSSPQISAGLASGFSELASILIRAKAQATARKVAMAADPAIQDILNLLAAEIGENHTDPCLRTTIFQTWNAKRDSLNAPFLEAKDADHKKPIVQEYASILAQRSAQDQSLMALRRALLALRDAHHGLAQGNETSIQAAFAISVNELQRTRDLYNQFANDLKK